MLVFGDRSAREASACLVSGLRAGIAAALAAPPGILRHAAWVSALIEAGRLAQGLEDEAFARTGADGPDPAGAAAMGLALALARVVDGSWSSGFAAGGTAEPVERALGTLARAPFPDRVETRLPEGFAFYAAYPELFLAAARRLPPGTQAVGIRSIGTALAALVAAATGGPAPWTVRPTGDPFRREVALSARRAAEVAAEPGRVYAVADEGPGLSGSSFAAAAAALEGCGLPPTRIHFLPSHAGGPGPEASAAIRARWEAAPRHVASFDDVVLRAPHPQGRLEAWFADLLGEADGPPEDIAGGGWRDRLLPDEAAWPPAHPWAERRKFLLQTETGPWLLRFAGLGREGTRKAERAAALAEAGFVPPFAGFRHGFTAERWLPHARPLRAGERPPGLVERVGEYLAFRARRFPAGPGRGADLPALHRMAVRNATLAFGPERALRLERLRPALPRLAGLVFPVETDNRLHAWEWLRAGPVLLKADALDHHAGHDLVGCQDIAWDAVGAGVELGLGRAEAEALACRIEAGCGRGLARELTGVLRPYYLAFQLGAATLAADAAFGRDAERHRRERDRYGQALARWLDGERSCTVPDM